MSTHDRYRHSFAELFTGGPLECMKCGAMVSDTEQHDAFHSMLDDLHARVAVNSDPHVKREHARSEERKKQEEKIQ